MTLSQTINISGAIITIQTNDQGGIEYYGNELAIRTVTEIAAERDMTVDQYLNDLAAKAKAHGLQQWVKATGGKLN